VLGTRRSACPPAPARAPGRAGLGLADDRSPAPVPGPLVVAPGRGAVAGARPLPCAWAPLVVVVVAPGRGALAGARPLPCACAPSGEGRASAPGGGGPDGEGTPSPGLPAPPRLGCGAGSSPCGLPPASARALCPAGLGLADSRPPSPIAAPPAAVVVVASGGAGGALPNSHSPSTDLSTPPTVMMVVCTASSIHGAMTSERRPATPAIARWGAWRPPSRFWPGTAHQPNPEPKRLRKQTCPLPCPLNLQYLQKPDYIS